MRIYIVKMQSSGLEYEWEFESSEDAFCFMETMFNHLAYPVTAQFNLSIEERKE